MSNAKISGSDKGKPAERLGRKTTGLRFIYGCRVTENLIMLISVPGEEISIEFLS
ncbi:hypothetical protein N752_00185 [Desulforamulus aquiferis]|nr:hypothetical protein N752_00185 [Desulforamulus aquiferis]